jgi:hypothetical protein
MSTNPVSGANFVYRGYQSSIPFQLGEISYTPTAGHEYDIEVSYFQIPFPTHLSGTVDDYDVVIKIDGVRGLCIGSSASDAVLVWSHALSFAGTNFNGWRYSMAQLPLNVFATNQSTVLIKISLVDSNGGDVPLQLDPNSDRPLLIGVRANFL